MKNVFTFLLLFSLNCSGQNNIENDFYEEDKTINLFAFVGKKISVIEFDPNTEKVEKLEIDSVTGEKLGHKSWIMDKGFRCKYLILQKVFNDFEKDTIDFIAYDHYGRPNFEDSEYVMLYISKDINEKYYHRKYQFDPLEILDNDKFIGVIYKVRKRGRGQIYKPKKATLKELFYNKKKNVFKI